MNVNLTPALEELVLGKVKTGRYNSASEVVREALRLMEQRDKALGQRDEERKLYLADLRHKIDAGLHSLDQGHGIDGATFFESLERNERPRRRAKGA
jgi:antitoxin ParD1/3/4